ncbi:MAG: VOC family protein [Ilumatobacter sp.]
MGAVHRFHLAVPVDDLAAAADFYGGVLGCPMGRSDTTWIDWDLFGHQVVTHLDDGAGVRVTMSLSRTSGSCSMSRPFTDSRNACDRTPRSS